MSDIQVSAWAERQARTIRIAMGAAIVAVLAGLPGRATAQSASMQPAAIPNGGSRTYIASQVDKPVVPKPYNAPPLYPEPLRLAGVEGTVLVRFVVDTTGRPDVTTLKVLKPTHPLFVQAVRTALPRMRFSPAELDGRKVKQLVQEPFAFRIACVPGRFQTKEICR